MKKAVFLDRDGVINRERGEHTWKKEDFELLPDMEVALKLLKENGWALIVITNQSGIGLGLYGHSNVEELHGILKDRLKQAGVELDAIFYCPHHPSTGKCLCRKPGSLLFEKAIARFNIDPSLSVMIGDRDRDMQAAEAVGIRGILVGANEPLLPLVRRELLKG
jgi:D-glycero-D-manno-heptose 1,7-bisphosphate phosphatase